MTTAETLIEGAHSRSAAPSTDLSSLVRGKMAGVDCLRGIAISAVVIYHGFGGSVPPAQLQGWREVFARVSLLGTNGVTLFFVLSGFLITGILLDVRESDRYYRNFYIRRVLRIVPAYLAMLALLKFSSRISWGYLAIAVMYLTNISSFFRRENEYGPLWSLSVEEQFYLVWPWIIRHLSRKRFTALCIGLVVCSPILRLFVVTIPSPLHDIHAKTPLVLDTFAAGALLAIIIRSPAWSIARLHRLGVACATGGAISVAVFVMASGHHGEARYWEALELCPYIVLFVGSVAWAVASPGLAERPVGKALAFLGYISYGLYLIHQFVFNIYDYVWRDSWAGDIAGSGRLLLLRFVVCSSVSICIASVSRLFFEQRFLDLKKRYAPSGSAS